MSHTRRLTDALRAEAMGQDLQQRIDGDIMVCGMREDGSLYELGSVSIEVVAQDPDAARLMIDRIKFWRPRAVDSRENRAVVPG